MNTSRIASALRTTGRRCMSANAKVWIDKDTRVICQGFTGKQVSVFGGKREENDANHSKNKKDSNACMVIDYRVPSTVSKRSSMEPTWWVV